MKGMLGRNVCFADSVSIIIFDKYDVIYFLFAAAFSKTHNAWPSVCNQTHRIYKKVIRSKNNIVN